MWDEDLSKYNTGLIRDFTLYIVANHITQVPMPKEATARAILKTHGVKVPAQKKAVEEMENALAEYKKTL